MSLDGVRLLPAVAFALLLLIAAAYDIPDRRIPNWTVVALIAVYVVAAVMNLTPQGWLPSLGAFAIALAGSGLLYFLWALGAGDSKLFSATALFLGIGNLALLTCATALAGGVLALGFMAFRPKSAVRGPTDRSGGEGRERGIPYGVAIAIGGITTAVIIRYLPL